MNDCSPTLATRAQFIGLTLLALGALGMSAKSWMFSPSGIRPLDTGISAKTVAHDDANTDWGYSSETRSIIGASGESLQVQLCQALGPAAPHSIWGVDSAAVDCGEATWKTRGCIDWQAFAQGEYVGHHRLPHVPEYRFRVDDQLEFRYRLTREPNSKAYQLQIGDTISVRSILDARLDDAQNQESSRDVLNQPVVTVQPDGRIILPLVGSLPAAGRTIEDLHTAINDAYEQFYRMPAITVTPVRVNTKLQDLLDTVDARAGQGGQRIQVRVAPDGTVQLPGIGSVPAQGLSDAELKREVDERYHMVVEGIEVTPLLLQRAPRYVYVLGEVANPGRFELTGPTTLMQALAMAGSFQGLSANLRQVVVFRRGDDWRLMATMLDLQGALYGRRPAPADEIWLNDSDIVVVPKTPLRVANELIEQVFTRGIYGVVPQGGPGIGINFSTLTSL